MKLTPQQRIEKVKTLNLCFNCLSHNHTASQCHRSLCRTCQRKHHTLLHLDINKPSAVQPCEIVPSYNNNKSKRAYPTETIPSNTSIVLNCRNISIRRQILLNTAIVYVEDSLKELHQVRVLLDSESICNFITENCVQRLGLRKVKQEAYISGVCGISSPIQYKVQATIESTTTNYNTDIEYFVTRTITAELPLEAFESNVLEIPKDLILADPSFNIPDRIDVLLGMDIYTSILENNWLPLLNGSPVMQETAFGWVIGGTIDVNKPIISALVSDEDLNNSLKRFWEIECCGTESNYTVEEKLAEQHFVDTHYRQNDGRYVVEMRFKRDCPKLGDSKQMALQRWRSLEKRLSRNWNLANEYADFISEYITLGHMTKVCSLSEYIN